MPTHILKSYSGKIAKQLEVVKQNFKHNQQKEVNKGKGKHYTLNFCFVNVGQI